MQKRWLNQNVNIGTLTHELIGFFDAKKFDITALKTETGYEIIAGNSPQYKMNSKILVTIDGKPNDFSIKLELHSEKKTENFAFPPILTTMFGGGYFLLKRLKSDETWMVFKKDFWSHANSIVAHIKDPAMFVSEKKTP